MQYAAAKQSVSGWERVWWDFNELNQHQHAETRWATVGALISSPFFRSLVTPTLFLFISLPRSLKEGACRLLLFLCPSSSNSCHLGLSYAHLKLKSSLCERSLYPDTATFK